MSFTEVSTGLLAVYRVSAPIDREAMRGVLAELGRENLLPVERSPHESLKSAMSKLWAKPGLLVRPSGSRNRLLLVDEKRHRTERNEYRCDREAVVEDDTVRVNDEHGLPMGYSITSPLQHEYERQLNLVQPADAGRVLVELFHQAGGVRCVKESGGLYWIAPGHIMRFRSLVATIRKIPEITLAAMDIVINEEAVYALTDSLVMEANAMRERVFSDTEKNGCISDASQHGVTVMTKRIDQYRSMFAGATERVDQAVSDMADAGASALLASIGSAGVIE